MLALTQRADIRTDLATKQITPSVKPPLLYINFKSQACSVFLLSSPNTEVKKKRSSLQLAPCLVCPITSLDPCKPQHLLTVNAFASALPCSACLSNPNARLDRGSPVKAVFYRFLKSKIAVVDESADASCQNKHPNLNTKCCLRSSQFSVVETLFLPRVWTETGRVRE